MTSERIIPDCMKSDPVPDVASADNKEKQTARMENLIEGQCPICHTQMKVSEVNHIPVHVCLEHSLVMPIRDPEEIQLQNVDPLDVVPQ